MSWSRSFLVALLFVISAFALAMGIISAVHVVASLFGYALCLLLALAALVWVASWVHEKTRRKEDR